MSGGLDSVLISWLLVAFGILISVGMAYMYHRDKGKLMFTLAMFLEKMKRGFVNLIINAIEAMPEGGTLTITRKESNGNLEIAFADTGVGMAKEIIEKLWTPLFTTKAKGLGLGLVHLQTFRRSPWRQHFCRKRSWKRHSLHGSYTYWA